MSNCRTHAHDIVTKYLARNEDACTLVGKVGNATILDSFVAEIYTIYNLCTLVAFGHSVTQGHAPLEDDSRGVQGVCERHCKLQCSRCLSWGGRYITNPTTSKQISKQRGF